MALSKVNFNSMNVTPSASKAIKFNSSNNGLETGDIGGSLVLISTQTASSSATIDFTSDIDSTYKEYQFHFTDIHPETNNVTFSFQVDTGTNTSYNITCTSTFFRVSADEADSSTAFQYRANDDQAQGTAFNKLCQTVGNDNDQSCTGILHLFDPSSTTFVKHFIATTNGCHEGDITREVFTAGYFNTTTALTRVRFKFDSGDIDSGTIKMYGVS